MIITTYKYGNTLGKVSAVINNAKSAPICGLAAPCIAARLPSHVNANTEHLQLIKYLSLCNILSQWNGR